MKRTELRRRKPMRRAHPHVSPHELYLQAEIISAHLAKNHARRQHACQAPGCMERQVPWEAHHVVEWQELRRLGLPKWNTMNVLRLCKHHHEQHTSHAQLLPLTALRNENYNYAFMVMGERAFNYLHRHYSGEDRRLDWWLGAWEHGRV